MVQSSGGLSVPRFGERFLCTSDAYDCDLLALAQQTVEKQGIRASVHQGVYCMVSGPTYESIAEGRALRTLGADAVGEWQLVLSRSMAVGMYVNNTDGECGWRLAG